MYKFSYRIAVCAFLILISSILILGQNRTQTLSCQGDVFGYPGPPPRYIIDATAPDGLRQISRTDTGARRFDLTFRPTDVSVIKGDQRIKFETSGGDGATWYAAYHYAGSAAPDKGAYILPVPSGDLPANAGEFKTFTNPTNYYKYNGGPDKPALETPFSDNSTIVKLPSTMDMSTADLQLGYYWFTLQAEFGSGAGRCFRTTPPVVIQVVPETKYDVDVTVKANSPECERASATATVTTQNIRPQDVTLRWEVTGPGDRQITPMLSPDRKTATINEKEGYYIFKVFASAPTPDGPRTDDATASVDIKNCDPPQPGVVGIVYFQFGVPYDGEETQLPDPENWTRDRRKPRRDKNPKYPKVHKTITAPVAIDNNTGMLSKIAERMKKDDTLELYIFGFTDIERTGSYSNVELADRRIKVVLAYLEANGVLMRNVKSAIIRNCSDQHATPHGTRWSDLRRWDRSVELFYVDPRSGPQPDPMYINDCTPKVKQ